MNKRLGISCLLLGFIVSGVAYSQIDQDLTEAVAQDGLGVVNDAFQENFFEALKQKAIENHDKAITSLEKCLELNDAEPAVYLELGKNHNLLSNHSRAASYLEQARTIVPEHEPILSELYKAYFLDQRFEEALSVVKELSALDPGYNEDLANLYFLNRQFDAALDLLDQLDEQLGNNEFRNGLRRQIYAMTDDVEAKIADLEGRIKKEPDEEKHYLNLIYVYSEAGDNDMAFATAKRLLEMDPSSEMVHLALYKFYLDEGRIEQAMESMKILFKGREVDEEIKYQVLNDLLQFIETHPRLENELQEVVKLFSEEESNIRIYEELGDFYTHREDFHKALAYYEQGLVDKISSFGLVVKALLLQIELQFYHDAIQLSERGLESFPSQAFLYLLQGTALNNVSDYQKAVDQLKNGMEFLENDLELEVAFYEQLVIANRALGNADEAAGFARNVAKLKLKLLDE